MPRSTDELMTEVLGRRRLGSLIALYERNYSLMREIIPDPRELTGALQSHSERDETLHLRVEEQTRYTSLLHLTYLLPADGDHGPGRAVPDLRVRLYHDARLAEVLGFDGMDDAPPGPGTLGRRWAQNLLLGKWLEFIRDNGHEFC